MVRPNIERIRSEAFTTIPFEKLELIDIRSRKKARAESILNNLMFSFFSPQSITNVFLLIIFQ